MRQELRESDVTYRSGDVEIKAFLVAPGEPAGADGASHPPPPAVIVIHEIWGLTDHIREVTRRFARLGYLALAPDLFSREGPPQFDAGDRRALMEFLAALPDRRLVGDLEAAVGYVKSSQGHRAPRAASVGFCMGGLYSYLLAVRSTELAAAVEFYGRIVYARTTPNKPDSPLDLAPQLKCPLLGNFGEQDSGIPQSDMEQLRARLPQSGQEWKINVYPGAGHAFFNDTRPSYNKAAATAAWDETVGFLRRHLHGP